MKITAFLLVLNSIIAFNFICSENKKFIESKTARMDKLLAEAAFEKGLIYRNTDTVETRLLKFRRRDNVCFYLFCVEKSNNGTIKIHTAEEITGYKIGAHFYLKHVAKEEHFFLRQIESGRVGLYERDGIPSDDKFLYYLHLENHDELFVIDPLEGNVEEHHMPNQTQSREDATTTYYVSKGIYDKFKIFVSRYFGDCELVRNMVNSGFYTANELPAIVENYNNCFEK